MLYLLRHGESEGNVDEDAYRRKGHEVELTERGRNQSHEAGKQLRTTVSWFSHVYSSPLTRAVQTTLKVLESMGRTFESKNAWVVQSIYEQSSSPLSSPRHGTKVDWSEYTKNVDYAYGDIGYMESFRSMTEKRCVPFADHLRKLHISHSKQGLSEPVVLIVSHDFFLRGLRLALFNQLTEGDMLEAVQHSSKFHNGIVVRVPMTPAMLKNEPT